MSCCVTGEFEASLKKEILPEYCPTACGAKITVKGTPRPGRTVSGKVMPLSEYPSPFQAAEDSVIRERPAVKVPVWLLVVHMGTEPKFTVPGRIENVSNLGIASYRLVATGSSVPWELPLWPMSLATVVMP
jgi:hypothetical protein